MYPPLSSFGQVVRFLFLNTLRTNKKQKRCCRPVNINHLLMRQHLFSFPASHYSILYRTLCLLSLLPCCLPDHILDHDVINFSDRIAVFQNFPRLIRVEMNLDQILISSRNQAVSLKIFRDVICDLILVKIPVSSVDQ